MEIELKPGTAACGSTSAIVSGAYQSADEVIEQAFQIIGEQLDLNGWMLEQRASVSAKIDRGFAQAEAGQLIDGDVAIEMLQLAAAPPNDPVENLIARFQLTPEAADDLDSIWCYIASDNERAADRVELEIISSCHRLAARPLTGTKRQDITKLLVRFRTVAKFPNYVIVYRPDTTPLQIIAILHGNVDLKAALEKRY